MNSRVVVSVSTSWSRDGLETYQRLVSVSSREKLSTSRSRLGLGQLRFVPKTNFRPNCACHISKTYAVWTDFRRLGFWSPHFFLPNICSLWILLLSYSWTSLSSSFYWLQRDDSWQPQPCRQSNTWWSLPPPCLVDVFLWQLFCRATFNSSVALGFEGICFTLPAWRPSSRAGTNLESFNEPGRVRLQPVLYDARNTENLGCLSSLKEHNFVIFRWISTKLCGKVYILPFNSLIVL